MMIPSVRTMRIQRPAARVGVSSRAPVLAPRRWTRRQAMVLIVVMIVVAMVALTGFRFAEYMVIENKAVQQYGEGLQAQHAVGSGEELLRVFLEQTPAARQTAGGSFDNRELFRGVPLLSDPESTTHCRFSIVSPFVREDDKPSVRFGVTNESARLNLAVLLTWDQHEPGSARRALMNLPGMTVEIADAILDWIDADSARREYGAEEDDYASATPAYGPRNGLPETLTELLLVRGVTRELLFGEQPTRDEQGTDHADLRRSRPAVGTTGDRPVPWASLLTLYSAERNIDPAGHPRIFLNDPQLATLQQGLAAVLDQRWADFIVAFRQYGAYDGPDPVSANPSFQLDPAVPARHAVRSILDLLDAKVRVPGKSKRPATILASPLTADPQKLREELPRVADYVSITRAETIVGRVNVNLAPEPVLRGVPGLDEATVGRILADRAGVDNLAEQPERRHATWLLTEQLVDRARMERLLPYLTAGGDVFRGQIIGFFDTPGPTARVEVVVDAARRPSRLVYRKDLGLLGPGYTRELLGAGLESSLSPGTTGTDQPATSTSAGTPSGNVVD